MRINNMHRKAFILSSLVGATLISANNGSPKLVALQRQINIFMRAFNKINRAEYWALSDFIKHLWFNITKKYDLRLNEDEIEVFIELLLNLIPKTVAKDLLKINFTTEQKVKDENKSSLLATVMDVDSEINKFLGTKQTATREELGAIIVKPIKPKKVKKERDIAVEKRIKKLRNRIKWARERAKQTV